MQCTKIIVSEEVYYFSVSKSFIHVPDMYLEFKPALYPKTHWYSRKMTSVRHIIHDVQE